MLEQVKTSLSNGVTFAEFPTTIEVAQACRENGIAIMVGAPNIVRGRSHSGNVSAAELAAAGLLDVISSDYVPSALLLSVFYLAERWNDLPRAVAGATANAASVVGAWQIGGDYSTACVEMCCESPSMTGRLWCEVAGVMVVESLNTL